MVVYPYELREKFRPRDLVGQFMLCKNAELIPEGWTTYRLNHWLVACHSVLPCTELNAGTRQTFGYLIGYYINREGVLLGSVGLGCLPNQPIDFESFLYGFSGRFVAVMLASDSARVYLDPCGSLSVVYSPHQEVVSSSPALIPYSEGTADKREFIEATGIPSTNAMYPLGATARHGVERLLPNHYLDLTSWQAVRHWPSAKLAKATNTSAAVAEIARLAKLHIAAVAEKFPLQMALTAGRDTRMLLAWARPWKQRIAFFTYALPDAVGRLDCYIAKRMAKRFGLPHKILPFHPASVTEKEEWVYRTGCSVGDVRGFEAVRTVKQLDPKRVYLPGFVGEVGRGFYWKHIEQAPGKSKDQVVDAKLLLAITQAPATEELIDRANKWLAAVPCDSALQVLDMFYIEQRLGCWAGVHTYAYAGMAAFDLWPLNCRRILELMLGLPEEYKGAARLNTDAIQAEWPELLDFPFNKVVGSHRVTVNLYRAKNAAMHPRRALKRIVQIALKPLH